MRYSQDGIEVARSSYFPIRFKKLIEQVCNDHSGVYKSPVLDEGRRPRLWLRVASTDCEIVIKCLNIASDELKDIRSVYSTS